MKKHSDMAIKEKESRDDEEHKMKHHKHKMAIRTHHGVHGHKKKVK